VSVRSRRTGNVSIMTAVITALSIRGGTENIETVGRKVAKYFTR